MDRGSHESRRWIGEPLTARPSGGPLPAWSAARFLADARRPCATALAGTGREALAWSLRILGCSGRRVLVPAYGCGALAQAVRAAGAEPRFYPGDGGLRPDGQALVRGASEPGVAAVLLVHAFGWLQEAPPALGAAVVEDATHNLCNAEGARYLGPAASAAAVASLRKHLPVVAGLAARWDGGTLPDPPGPPSPVAAAFAASRAAAAEAHGSRRHAALAGAEELLDAPGLRPGPPPDAERRALEALAARPEAELARWRARCRDNWQALHEAVPGRGSARAFHAALPARVCPLGYVIRHPDRTALAARLLRRGVVATQHWPVAAEARPVLTREERMLSGTILTLPCDGRYGPEDMERVAAALSEAG